MREDLRGFRRIVILGNTGSGKSYLARWIAGQTGLPLFHLDTAFWRPGWEKTPREEWIRMQQEWTAQERWIMEGNYFSTLDLRYAAADLVIHLDIPRPVCLLSVIRRHGKRRPDLPEYLEEHFDRELLDFCVELWRMPKRTRPLIQALRQAYPHIPFWRFRSRRQVRRWMRTGAGEKGTERKA